MSDRIPTEVLIDILARLPIKDLLRFTAVSKPFRSLIVSPGFISVHSARIAAAAKTDLLLVRSYHEGDRDDDPGVENYSIHFDDNAFGLYKRFDLPFKSFNFRFRVIASINGVIALSDDAIGFYNVVILWNPSIKRYKFLPSPIANFRSHGPYMQAFGFGFNATTSDYKVVRLVYVDSFKGYGLSKVPPEVEVCDMSAGSWRNVDTKGFSYVVDRKAKQTFFNGAIHWVGKHSKQYSKPEGRVSVSIAIVTFDIEKEVLGTIEVPEVVAKQYLPLTCRVALVGESLSLIHHDESWDGSHHNTCNVWVMKQYGVVETWTKLYTIALPVQLWDTFGSRKNEELLMSRRGRNPPLVSCDPSSAQLKELGIRGYGEYLCVEKFVESLSLLAVKIESAENLPAGYLK